MKIENKLTYHQALAKLQSWDRTLKYYDFYRLNDMELYNSYSNLDVDLKHYITPEALNNKDVIFKSFANAGDGGEFAIWFYDGAESQPAVVYFDSDFELSILATSMHYFVCQIAQGNVISPTSDEPWGEIYEWVYEDLAEWYEEEQGEELSPEEMKELVAKDIAKMHKFVENHDGCEFNRDDFERLKSKLSDIKVVE